MNLFSDVLKRWIQIRIRKMNRDPKPWQKLTFLPGAWIRETLVTLLWGVFYLSL